MNYIKQSEVLDEDGIGSGGGDVEAQLCCFVEFVVMEQGIDSDINLGIKLMGIVTKCSNILYTIICCCPGTKTCGTDVHSISTMVDSSNAAFEVFGRGKKLELCQILLILRLMIIAFSMVTMRNSITPSSMACAREPWEISG